MINTKSRLGSLTAALTIALMGAMAPALSSRRGSPVVANMPGERMLPRRFRPKAQGPDDLARLDAAAAKRRLRNAKRQLNELNGAFVSTHRWLAALANRQNAKAAA